MMGSLMLLFTGFGWAKPVPVNPARIRQHSNYALMLVALSGPHLISYSLFGIHTVRFGWVKATEPLVAIFLRPSIPGLFLLYQSGLMLFNLILCRWMGKKCSHFSSHLLCSVPGIRCVHTDLISC
jgi:hypothetical protein